VLGHPPRSSQRIETGIVLLAASALAVVLLWRDPHHDGAYGTCPFLAITGFNCPGCGSLRALYDLFHGEFLEAVGHNALFIAFVPLTLFVALRTLLFGDRREHRMPRWFPAAALALLALWTIVRNVPIVPFLGLAP
jgi:Protein of unknown function (DUF2752)